MDDPVTILREHIVQNHYLNIELSSSRIQKAHALQTVRQQEGHIVFGAQEMLGLTESMVLRTGVNSGTHDPFHEILLAALHTLSGAHESVHDILHTALPELKAANRNIQTEIDANYNATTAFDEQAHNNRRWVMSEERFKHMSPQDRARVEAQGALVLPSAGIGSPGGGDDAFEANGHPSKRKRWGE